MQKVKEKKVMQCVEILQKYNNSEMCTLMVRWYLHY